MPCGWLEPAVGYTAGGATGPVLAESKRQLAPPLAVVNVAVTGAFDGTVRPLIVRSGAKFAVIDLSPVAAARLHAVPVQSPLNPLNVNPAFGVAVQFTVALATYGEVPQLMLPAVAGTLAVVTVY